MFMRSMIIDYHSHILPGIDDGSSCIDESVTLLRMLCEQNVGTVIATPHFNANRTNLKNFLSERDAAFNELRETLKNMQDVPLVIKGAEIRYYPGISRLKELDELRIGDTQLLLLEMPFEKWSEYAIEELLQIGCRGEYKVIIAHIERYFSYFRGTSFWEGLSENGILLQSNATFFANRKTRHKAVKLFKSGLIDVIGSDCHNIDERPPMISDARDIIESKLGTDIWHRYEKYSNSILKDNIIFEEPVQYYENTDSVRR